MERGVTREADPALGRRIKIEILAILFFSSSSFFAGGEGFTI